MNDEQFEGRMQIVEVEVSQLMANQLRARDTAQREALAEAVGLLRDYGHSTPGVHIIQAFIDRIAQAEQQEAQGAQAGDERELFNRAYEEMCNRPITIREIAQRMWMARAALATRAAAGEPIHQWADQDLWMDGDEADMASARAEGFKTRTLWTVPPAAAHGDEAVRKDAERYRWLNQECQKGGQVVFLDVEDVGFATGAGATLDNAIDAAMRAQAGEGGEV